MHGQGQRITLKAPKIGYQEGHYVLQITSTTRVLLLAVLLLVDVVLRTWLATNVLVMSRGSQAQENMDVLTFLI